MSSFLNVGGSLIDLGTKYQYSEGISKSDQEFYSQAEKVVLEKAAEAAGLDPVEVAEGIARTRRARRAIQIALLLAAADGPLPIGDMLAIGVLGAYAGYEIYKTVETFV
jgi:hypothetical protein